MELALDHFHDRRLRRLDSGVGVPQGRGRAATEPAAADRGGPGRRPMTDLDRFLEEARDAIKANSRPQTRNSASLARQPGAAATARSPTTARNIASAGTAFGLRPDRPPLGVGKKARNPPPASVAPLKAVPADVVVEVVEVVSEDEKGAYRASRP